MHLSELPHTILSETEKLRLLVTHFNELFAASENTLLQTGATEPFYRASVNAQPAIIYSRYDYLSSALHEISHWCIAGKQRRQLDDFGYWYHPEGREQQQQLAFEQVEVKPQAVEWALSLACVHQFNFSADNLAMAVDASESFKQAVTIQKNKYINQSELPDRAQRLYQRLLQVFQADKQVELAHV